MYLYIIVTIVFISCKDIQSNKFKAKNQIKLSSLDWLGQSDWYKSNTPLITAEAKFVIAQSRLPCFWIHFFFSLFDYVIAVSGRKTITEKNLIWIVTTAWKVFKYGVFSGPYFPVFGLNTEIYSINLRIQPEYTKIRTRKKSIFGHFLRSVLLT